MSTPILNNWDPMYIAQLVIDNAGDSVTAERWKELWTLAIEQGDYNSETMYELLKLLFETILHPTVAANFVSSLPLSEDSGNTVGAQLRYLQRRWDDVGMLEDIQALLLQLQGLEALTNINLENLNNGDIIQWGGTEWDAKSFASHIAVSATEPLTQTVGDIWLSIVSGQTVDFKQRQADGTYVTYRLRVNTDAVTTTPPAGAPYVGWTTLTAYLTGLFTLLGSKVDTTTKNVSNGYPGLDSRAKVLVAQLPITISVDDPSGGNNGDLWIKVVPT